MLSLFVDHRDNSKEPDGFLFPLSIEPCESDIELENFQQIFSELTVTKTMSSRAIATPTYEVSENILHFGSVHLNHKVSVRVKIINKAKVPCDVAVTFRSKTDASTKGRSTASFAMDIFSVEPPMLTLQPHEIQFVTISFCPTTIQPYFAEFDAVVDSGLDSQKSLYFDMRGEGALPRAMVVQPIGKA